jgi:hypothetical protein
MNDEMEVIFASSRLPDDALARRIRQSPVTRDQLVDRAWELYLEGYQFAGNYGVQRFLLARIK